MLTPKKIWIRSVGTDKVSCAEYIRNKRFNIIPSFKVDDKEAHAEMRKRLGLYQYQNNNRPLVAVIPYNDFRAKHIADVLELPLE